MYQRTTPLPRLTLSGSTQRPLHLNNICTRQDVARPPNRTPGKLSTCTKDRYRYQHTNRLQEMTKWCFAGERDSVIRYIETVLHTSGYIRRHYENGVARKPRKEIRNTICRITPVTSYTGKQVGFQVLLSVVWETNRSAGEIDGYWKKFPMNGDECNIIEPICRCYKTGIRCVRLS